MAPLGRRYSPSFLQGTRPRFASGTLMSLRAIPSSRAGIRRCSHSSFAPTGAPALAELGHPDVAAGRYSGTALACATRNPFIASPQVGAQTPLRNHHRTQIPILFPGELSAVPNPSILLPASAHTLPKPRARGVFPDAPRTHYSTFPERGGDRGEAGMFRRDIRVSEAERGRVPCRS